MVSENAASLNIYFYLEPSRFYPFFPYQFQTRLKTSLDRLCSRRQQVHLATFAVDFSIGPILYHSYPTCARIWFLFVTLHITSRNKAFVQI